MNSLTAGHFEASFSASAVVILRQLLSPKPSASASEISSSPHHEGAPPVFEAVSSPPPPVSDSASVSAAPVLPPPLVVSSPPPHAASPSANRIRATATAVARFGSSLSVISLSRVFIRAICVVSSLSVRGTAGEVLGRDGQVGTGV